MSLSWSASCSDPNVFLLIWRRGAKRGLLCAVSQEGRACSLGAADKEKKEMRERRNTIDLGEATLLESGPCFKLRPCTRVEQMSRSFCFNTYVVVSVVVVASVVVAGSVGASDVVVLHCWRKSSNLRDGSRSVTSNKWEKYLRISCGNASFGDREERGRQDGQENG